VLFLSSSSPNFGEILAIENKRRKRGERKKKKPLSIANIFSPSEYSA